MTRTTQIQIAVGLVVLGGLALAVWLGQGEGALKVTYAGVCTNNSFAAWFTVTNRTKESFEYYPYVSERRFGLWTNVSRTFWGVPPEIAGESATNYLAGSYATNGYRWRVDLMHHEAPNPPFAARFRRRLSDYARQHGFPRMGQWLRPRDGFQHAYGPEMLGNKPVAPDKR